ncbi:hypothetical protein M1307_02680 [Patescibacteria group bacterium]|nr:hypothetical protein [Patescibacteria group bacterium]
MIYLPFVLLAYFFNGVAVLVDKFLLTSKVTNPLIVIFYISFFSMFILFLIPFTSSITVLVFILASLSTIVWTLGATFLYKALQIGLVTRVIPVIGTIIPITLLISAVYTKSITNPEILAVIVLIFGLIFLTIFEWRGKITPKEIFYEVLSAVLFAISYLILREAYLRQDFFTVLVWSRVILAPVGILIVLIPASRRIVFSKNENSFSLFSKPGIIFLAGQSAGGISELLITFSVSLATPALVNSLQGSQYLFLFVASLFLGKKFPEIFKEQHTHLKTTLKVIGILCIAFGF